MPITGSNQWGPFVAAGDGDTTPTYPPSTTPTPTGDLAPPQSPTGSVTNEAATYNNAEGVTSTENMLSSVLQVESDQQGTAFQNAPTVYAGYNVSQVANSAATPQGFVNLEAGYVPPFPGYGSEGSKFS